MPDCMTFPETMNGFFEQYGIWDREEVYTNGSLLIPVFRVKQMIEHYFKERTCRKQLVESEYDEIAPSYICSECDAVMYDDEFYCATCGAKVVE